MPKQNIKIDRLEIRLRGVSPESISSTVREFGQDLLQRLSTGELQTTKRIDRVDSGTLKIAAGTKPGELSSRMAKQVAAAIRSKLK